MDDEHREEERVEAAVQYNEPQADLEWLEPIYRKHSKMVFRAAYRITGNAADAEDVLQTVFFRLARRTDPPDLGSGAQAYLYRAAVNAGLDLVQSRRVRTSSPLNGMPDPVSHRPDDAPDKRQLADEIKKQLRKAVTRLNRRAAEMFTLRFFEGLGNQEIAQIFDTTPKTVAVTLHRARMRLIDDLSPYLGGKS